MSLTVVINCADDLRLFRCIDSIDFPVEVVCAITPSEIIEERLRIARIRYAIAAFGNHAAVTNAGISLVETEKFVLMDSDCVFVPGALAEFNETLETYSVVKGRIGFLSRGSIFSRWRAVCRSFDNTYQAPLYKPGLGLRQDVALATGGWFHPELRSTEDADLAFRIRRANLPTLHLDRICLLHDPTTFSDNVKSYIAYGRGARVRHEFLGGAPEVSAVRREMARARAFVRESGIAPLPQFLANRACYYYGYYVGRYAVSADRKTARAQP